MATGATGPREPAARLGQGGVMLSLRASGDPGWWDRLSSAHPKAPGQAAPWSSLVLEAGALGVSGRGLPCIAHNWAGSVSPGDVVVSQAAVGNSHPLQNVSL